MEPDTDSPVPSGDKTSLGFTAKSKPVDLQGEKVVPQLLKLAREIYDQKAPPARRPGCQDCQLVDELARAVRMR